MCDLIVIALYLAGAIWTAIIVGCQLSEDNEKLTFGDIAMFLMLCFSSWIFVIEWYWGKLRDKIAIKLKNK